MAVAIMALAEVMDANGVEEHGAADQMNVQDHLIVQYSKALKKIEDQSHALDTGTIDDEVQYTVLEAEMNIISNKESNAQQQLEITTELHLRDPSQANETAANIGRSYDRLYQAIAKIKIITLFRK